MSASENNQNISASIKAFRASCLAVIAASKGEASAKFVAEIADMLTAGRTLVSISRLPPEMMLIFIDILADTNACYTDLAVAHYLGKPEKSYVEALMNEARTIVDGEYKMMRDAAGEAAPEAPSKAA